MQETAPQTKALARDGEKIASRCCLLITTVAREGYIHSIEGGMEGRIKRKNRMRRGWTDRHNKRNDASSPPRQLCLWGEKGGRRIPSLLIVVRIESWDVRTYVHREGKAEEEWSGAGQHLSSPGPIPPTHSSSPKPTDPTLSIPLFSVGPKP